jgi:hypothetical protein
VDAACDLSCLASRYLVIRNWADVSFTISTAVVKMYTAPTPCGDLQDGETVANDPTRSNSLAFDAVGNSVATTAFPRKCAEAGQVYCDGSFDSGRQVGTFVGASF